MAQAMTPTTSIARDQARDKPVAGLMNNRRGSMVLQR
jgi:hypothetical protein